MSSTERSVWRKLYLWQAWTSLTLVCSTVADYWFYHTSYIGSYSVYSSSTTAENKCTIYSSHSIYSNSNLSGCLVHPYTWPCLIGGMLSLCDEGSAETKDKAARQRTEMRSWERAVFDMHVHTIWIVLMRMHCTWSSRGTLTSLIGAVFLLVPFP